MSGPFVVQNTPLAGRIGLLKTERLEAGNGLVGDQLQFSRREESSE